MAVRQKGERVQIVRGRKGNGVTGVVFWVGPDRFDDTRTKVGVNGDDGEKYWVYEDYTIPSAATQAPPANPRVQKGDRVVWREGHATGDGVAFWVGPSKQGPGLRVGVALRDGTRRFFALNDVEAIAPYPLYGTDADAWEEGGLLERSVDIAFAREPQPAELEAMAERIHADLRAGADVLRYREFVWLPLAPQPNAEALAAAQAWLDEVDHIVPIRHVVFLPGEGAVDLAQLAAGRPHWPGLVSPSAYDRAQYVDAVFADVRARRAVRP